ncbi:DNA-directed RNA polymerase III subunit RPC6-like [Sycon ciliatum]|uniref:DNA-directed RNA polymerase III subunit RPC6-like n=1 Tax=Sycon ciliatum TaxID=27933 RepID=UPI0020ADBD28|eukprot:scpid85127/ scgid25572/ DNA-directed RNA polymerase III subunit RPC6; DNA-directed RNA polymerase III subunit F
MAVAEVVIKQEAAEVLDLEVRILELCQRSGEVSHDLIRRELPQHVEAARLATAINRLLSTGRLEVLKQGDVLFYRTKNTEVLGSLQGADNEEKLVYQIVEQAQTKGIWTRDIRQQSGLNETQLKKVLKTLESKKIIKQLKSVGNQKKKVYMLFNLEPDQSVTGGPWFTDQDFESEFVDVLMQQCLKFLQSRASTLAPAAAFGGVAVGDLDPIARRSAALTNSSDVWEFINRLGVSKVKLTVEHIEMLLGALIYDGKVEREVTSGMDGKPVVLYRARSSTLAPTGLMCTPCAACPLVFNCCEGSAVSPSTCVYMKEWLDW